MESNNCTENEIIVNEVPLSLNEDQTTQSDNGQCDPNDVKSEESVDCQKSASDEVIDSDPIDGQSDANDDQTDDKAVDSAKASRHQYSKEQLIAISKVSSARIRPKCLDNTFNNSTNGLWDPEKWMASKSSAVIASNNKYNYSKRDGKANNDLKDRVLEEETDIILSPQRGSFGTGCHVSTTSFVANKVGSDSRNRDHYSDRNKMEDSNDSSHRQNMNRHQRVGTGRIVPKDRERSNDWMDRSFDRERERSYDHRSDGRDGRDRTDDYNDRRNRRFFDRRPNMNSNRNNRFDSERFRDHNRYSREEEDEPEWFTEGPTSKHETIELKGFDDDSEHRKKRKDSDLVTEKARDGRTEAKDSENERKPKMVSVSHKDLESNIKEVKNESKTEDFDVNELFKTDDFFRNGYEAPDNKMISSSDGISDNAVNECDISGKSRFKRWFCESPTTPTTTQFNDNFQTNESNIYQKETKATVPTPRAPMSANQTPNLFSTESNERNIFDLLKGSNRLSMDQIMAQNKFDPKKAMNVSEIEANLKQMDVRSGEELNNRKAFEKLMNSLGKKSTQTPNVFERVHNFNEPKGEAMIFQTPDQNVVFPNSHSLPPALNAPTLMQLLEAEENKEKQKSLADSQRNRRAYTQNSPISQRNGSNVVNAQQMPNTIQMFANSMSAQDWQNTSPLMKTVRPRNPSVQEMSDNTNYIFQSALIKRQQMEPTVKSQQLAESIRTNTPMKGMSNSNFFLPTSVIRKMHSEKDKELVHKSVTPFDDFTPESNASQQKFLNEQLIMKPMAQSSPRAIIKSNNPMGPSMAVNKPVPPSPLSPQSDSMPFATNSDTSFNASIGLQSHQHLLQQHFQQQQQQQQQHSQTHQRALNPSNPSLRSFGSPISLSQSSLSGVSARPSTPSPNANNNMQINMNSTQNMVQKMNPSNVRPNVNSMQMNQMMSSFQLLHQMPQQSQSATPSDSRHSQYNQLRSIPPMTANPSNAHNIQQLLFNKGSNSDQMKYSFDRNMMSESEQMSRSMATTYTHPRPQVFANSGHLNHTSDSRFLGQFFTNEVLNNSIPEMPAVPLKNALTLDDIERL